MAVQVRQISPGYLRAMGIPVLRGRDVLDSDEAVLLVSQDAAKLYWGAEDAIGRRAILPALSETVLRQVVGIVGDVKQRKLTEASTPTVYFYTREPYGRATFAILSIRATRHARTASRRSDPRDRSRAAGRRHPDDGADRRRGADVAALQRAPARSLRGRRAAPRRSRRLQRASYIVRGRSREIGIRTALGARRADVLRLVVVEGMSPALAGIAAGMIAARVGAVLKMLAPA